MTSDQDSDVRAAWDAASGAFLSRRDDTATTVTYGNLAPGENDLQLLGELRGRRVLDLGCGGGHNAVACALAGAQVTAVDPSMKQLAAAHRLIAGHEVQVDLRQGSAEHLVASGLSFDLILAVQVLPYVTDLTGALAACRRIIVSSGQLVVSLDHPFRNCFFDEESDEMAAYPTRSYFDTSPLAWSFVPDRPMQSRHLPLSAWVDAFSGAGFRVERLVEPLTPASIVDDIWPEDGPLAPLRAVPHTLISLLTPA